MTDADDSQGNAVAFNHYRDLTGDRRRSYNNILVAVYSRAGRAKPIAFLRRNSFSGPTDGNVYHRIGTGAHPYPKDDEPLSVGVERHRLFPDPHR